MKLIIKLFVAVCLLFVTIISLRAQAPDWVWAKAGAGTIDDIVTGMTIDKDENIILTGFFYGSSITFGTTTLTGAGHFDMFIVKYDANGNVLWAKSAGGANADNGSSITVDADGNIYVAGRIGSQPFAFDSIILTSAGNLFIVKCDPVGNVLWAKSASGVKNAETPEIELSECIYCQI
jgi:outer membrane protein assembly factor BamB